MHNNLFNVGFAIEGFPPYLLGDSGHALSPWLVTPFKDIREFTMFQILYFTKLLHGRCIFKQTFCEPLEKSNMSITFLLDLITCSVILHNMLVRQSNGDFKQLLHVLGIQETEEEVINKDDKVGNNCGRNGEEGLDMQGQEKRSSIALYLVAQQNICM